LRIARREAAIPKFFKARTPLFCFLILYLLFSVLKSKDYGITWDEYIVYMGGYWLSQDVAGHPQAILRDDSAAPGSPHYDQLYPMLLYDLNQKLSIGRFHLSNMALGASGFWVSYEAVLPVCLNAWWALAGPLFLVLNPRFFGELSNNPKDMPFALFYFAALCLVYRWKRVERILPLLALGLLIGAASCVRLLGLSLILIYALAGIWEGFLDKDRPGGKWVLSLAWRSSFLGAVAFILLWATWPFLREDFFSHGLRLLQLSSSFPWNGLVLFNGREIPATQLGRAYLPVWLLITTPLFILILSAMGLWNRLREKTGSLGFFISWVLLLHLAVYFAVKPVLYDGIRHYLFLEPVLSLLACLTFLELFQGPLRAKWAWGAVLGLDVFLVVWHMAALHPYEYTYFNETVGGLKGAAGRFETEYSGTSYKEATEWLRANETADPNRIYRINTEGSAFQSGNYFSPNMKWAYFQDADYYIANSRWNLQQKADPRKTVYVVAREGVPFCYVFKLR
jgi:hypothetical protein